MKLLILKKHQQSLNTQKVKFPPAEPGDYLNDLFNKTLLRYKTSEHIKSLGQVRKTHAKWKRQSACNICIESERNHPTYN